MPGVLMTVEANAFTFTSAGPLEGEDAYSWLPTPSRAVDGVIGIPINDAYELIATIRPDCRAEAFTGTAACTLNNSPSCSPRIISTQSFSVRPRAPGWFQATQPSALQAFTRVDVEPVAESLSDISKVHVAKESPHAIGGS